MSSSEKIDMMRARLEDLNIVVGILDESARWLLSTAIDQWNPSTFGDRAMVQRIQNGEVFLAKLNGEIYGTLTLQQSDKLIWGDVPDDALYVHRFAVKTLFHWRKLGRRMLEWAAEQAKQARKAYLRLDCIAGNSNLRKYYEKAGFRHKGDKIVGNWHASLYELPLRG